MAESAASCSGDNDGSGGACAVNGEGSACDGDSSAAGYNCVYQAAVCASAETCLPLLFEPVFKCEKHLGYFKVKGNDVAPEAAKSIDRPPGRVARPAPG